MPERRPARWRRERATNGRSRFRRADTDFLAAFGGTLAQTGGGPEVVVDSGLLQLRHRRVSLRVGLARRRYSFNDCVQNRSALEQSLP